MTCAIIACLKREELYVKEWLDWHISIGVDHFYLCDNNDKDYEPKLQDVVKDYIDQGIVEVFDYSGIHPIQPICYTEIYDKYGDLYDWWMVIDIDEFLDIPYTNNDLKDFLNLHHIKYKFNIALMWRNYGDNDLLEYDGRGCLERFTKPATCIKNNWYTIINGISNQSKSLFKGKKLIYDQYKIIPIINHHHNVFYVRHKDDPLYVIKRFDVLSKKIYSSNQVYSKYPIIENNKLSNFWRSYSYQIYSVCYLKHFKVKTIQEYMNRIDRGDTLVCKNTHDYPYSLGHFFSISQETDEKDKYLFDHYGIKRGKYK